MSDRNSPLRQLLDTVTVSGESLSHEEVTAELVFKPGLPYVERRECVDAVVAATVQITVAKGLGENAHARQIAAETADEWGKLIGDLPHPSEKIPENDARALADAITGRRMG